VIEFRCRLCGKRFSNFEEVKKHVIEYHKVPGKGFNIAVCRLVNFVFDEGIMYEYLSRFGIDEFEIEDITCRNAWFEVTLGIDYGRYSWLEIGRFLDNLKNNGIRVISLKTDWYGDYGLEEYGLIVKVWLDVRKFLVGVMGRGEV